MNFAEVLSAELELIATRRQIIRRMAPPGGAEPGRSQERQDGDPETRKPGEASAATGSEAAAENSEAACAPPGNPSEGAVGGELPGAVEPEDPEKAARLESLDRHIAGLALSGGGIRSATFALGVLQGLAHLNILSRFDYLSTVSGGGYIGGWLAAWMKREGNPLNVEKQLSPSRIVQARSDRWNPLRRSPLPEGRIVDEEPEPVHHLRAYSNYLTPRPGLLSVDTWTVLTIYVRNALINLLLILPLTMIAVLLGRCLVWCFVRPDPSEALRSVVFGSFWMLLFGAVLSLGLHLRYILSVKARGPGDRPSSHPRGTMRQTLAWTILLPLVVASVLACWSFGAQPRPSPFGPPGHRPPQSGSTLRLPTPTAPAGTPLQQSRPYNLLLSIYQSLFDLKAQALEVSTGGAGLFLSAAIGYGLAFGGLTLLVHVIGYLTFLTTGLDPDTIAREEGEERNRLVGLAWMSLAAFIAGFNGGFLFYAMVSQVLWRLVDQPYAVVTIGPPLAIQVIVAATFVEVWLLGRWQVDGLREWWARVCAWLVIVAAAWLAFFTITLYGPMAVNFLLRGSYLGSAGALVGWLVTAAGGAWAGRRPEAAAGGSGWLLKVLVRVAPPVFEVGLLIVVAMLVDALVFERLDDRLWGLGSSGVSIDRAAAWVYWNGIVTTEIDRIGQVAGVCVVLFTLAATMSNVNLFSMNAMYASRLTRCYLGASRRKRDWGRRGAAWQAGSGGAPTGAGGAVRWENSVTGFDPTDDLALWRLKIGAAAPAGAPRGGGPPYLGPHLILNTALNLVSGSELAWQDRKAESFFLSPAHCGSKGTGYAATTARSGRELTLGRAMAISGAAIDSNIGVHQSSALIALMTAFNARLGWWIQNPNPATWRPRWLRLPGNADRMEWDGASPSLALPLLLELVGRTDETQEYIHLSDGGHFENLGVYELVRRRCRYILCCDAGTDPQAADDNLANMIRLCRTDFGVRIDIDTSPFARQGEAKLSRWHCAVGKIRYDDVDGGELPGVFVYLRTTLTGDEPPDVQEYAAKHPDFPWQSTLDQFFDEPQFESYRALGFHIAQAAFKDAMDDLNDAEPLWSNHGAEVEFKRGNQRLFSAVRRRWAPEPLNQDHSFLQALESWTDLQKALRTDKDLVPLSESMYPEMRAAALAATGLDVPQLHAVSQTIQVMENAWLNLQLSGFRDLPMNRGWMSLFRRWASTPALQRLWPILRGEYGQDFVKFCETQLELGARAMAVRRDDLVDPFRAEAMAILSEEFTREWPGQSPLPSLVAQAEQNWTGWAGPQQPIAFIILAPHGPDDRAGSTEKVACGIAFASRLSSGDPDRHQPPRFEIFVWMRRAYRGMGIASRCARSILEDFSQISRRDLDDGEFVVQARYPAEPTERGDEQKEEMEYLLWLNFFNHYDFRCPRGRDSIQDGYWVIERTFGPHDEL